MKKTYGRKVINPHEPLPGAAFRPAYCPPAPDDAAIEALRKERKARHLAWIEAGGSIGKGD